MLSPARLLIPLLLAGFAATAAAQEPPVLTPLPSLPRTSTLVQISAEAQRSAPNDLFRATVFAEDSSADSAALARQINQKTAAGLAAAKAFGAVKAQTGASFTTPLYAKNQRTIESWRMRSEIQLESRDPAALAELLGKLQTSLGVSNLTSLSAPETRRKAEGEASVAAIAAFRERAALVADTLGRKYRIRDMAINSSSNRPQQLYEPRAMSMVKMEGAPMPVEAGESLIVVNINGNIELYE